MNCQRKETEAKVRFLEIGRAGELGERKTEVRIDLSGFDILSCILHLRKILLLFFAIDPRMYGGLLLKFLILWKSKTTQLISYNICKGCMK